MQFLGINYAIEVYRAGSWGEKIKGGKEKKCVKNGVKLLFLG